MDVVVLAVGGLEHLQQCCTAETGCWCRKDYTVHAVSSAFCLAYGMTRNLLVMSLFGDEAQHSNSSLANLGQHNAQLL